jgi:Xaa-Pro dipeptidase
VGEPGVITAPEYLERQRRVAGAAADRGLDALVVLSRGSHDRVADALWLTGVATPQPFVPDLAGHWRAAGHVAVVVARDGTVTVVVESEEVGGRAVADQVVVAGDVIAAVAGVVGRMIGSRRRARIGVVGCDAFPAIWWTALEQLVHGDCPDATLEPADDLQAQLRQTKSVAEQRLLRAAGRLGGRAMSAALKAAVPGGREADVAAALFREVVQGGGAVYDVVVSSGAASITLGPDGGAAGAAHWTSRELRHGDLLRIDAYGSVSGYLFDFARTVVVGGSPSDAQQELIDALRTSVEAGIATLRPGVAVAAVAQACEAALASSAHARRHGVPGHIMDGFWGHGLGLSFEAPLIGPASRELVQSGWCLAIERRAAVPGLGGAQYEDNVLIGPHGAELLTETPGV